MSLIVAEYDCSTCGRFELTIERPAPDAMSCPECVELAPWCISAPKPRILTVKPTAAVRGKPADAPSPLYMNTEKLADGQTPAEFAKERAKVWREERERQIRKTVAT
jgi:hypothetical protein